MLSKEEQKAIEEFKRWVELEKKNKDKINNADLLIEVQEIIINLIEKQSKEIEELKEKEKNLLIQLKDSEKELLEVCEKLRNSVSKDKIKAKIEELEKYRDKFYERNMSQDVIIKQNIIQVLQSLLEEE